MADAADAEGFDLGQFAGVEDVTLGLDPLVEFLELVARIFRGVEGGDDGRLNGRRQEAAQPQVTHLFHQCLAVGGVACVPGRQAAFFVVLQQGFVQRRDHMGRRGEAPLAGLGHVGVLVLQVHRQRMRVAGGAGQGFFASEDKTHARHALQAFARGGDQCVERHLLRIHWQGAEGAHGVDDQALAVLRHYLGDLWQRIEDAGTGFAVNQGDMGNVLIGT
ncbi:hypothetical protein D3C85_1268500 [compost metagenome]